MILDDLIKQMCTLGGPGGDIEAQHGYADLLLADALVLIAGSCCGPSVQKQVDDLIEAYENVDKWYA